MHQYRIKPACLPGSGSKQNIVFFGENNRAQLTDCFRTYFETTNGMVMKRDKDIDTLLHDYIIAAYVENGGALGYLAYNFNKVNPAYNYMDDMVVSEWIWNTPSAFAGLAAFMHSQSDQVNRVILNTPEENLFLTLADPSNGQSDAFKNTTHEMYVTASDSMYKIIDIRRLFSLFADYSFNGANLTVKFAVSDGFAGQTTEEFTLAFKEGAAKITPAAAADVTVSMTIDAFTAMFCGTADFKELYKLNCAGISDECCIDAVSSAFHYPERPKTITYF